MILLTGSTGQLGTAFRRLGLPDTRFLDRNTIDLTQPQAVASLIRQLAPDLLINCAAYTAVDAAEADEHTADLVNHQSVEAMSIACRDIGARFVTYSTDYVFDGTKAEPYVESDPRLPINAYGRTKAIGETACLEQYPEAVVIRTSWVISGTHPNFVRTMLDRGSQGKPLRVVDDQRGQATVTDDLALSTLEAVNRGMSGIIHLSNPGPLTWYELAHRAFELANLDVGLLTPCTSEEYNRPARRPTNSVLGSERVDTNDPIRLPPIEKSLPRVVAALLHP